jgi:hypothetical protein
MPTENMNNTVPMETTVNTVNTNAPMEVAAESSNNVTLGLGAVTGLVAGASLAGVLLGQSILWMVSAVRDKMSDKKAKESGVPKGYAEVPHEAASEKKGGDNVVADVKATEVK